MTLNDLLPVLGGIPDTILTIDLVDFMPDVTKSTGYPMLRTWIQNGAPLEAIRDPSDLPPVYWLGSFSAWSGEGVFSHNIPEQLRTRKILHVFTMSANRYVVVFEYGNNPTHSWWIWEDEP